MQTVTYEPVPFSVGGVAHPKPGPITNDASAKHFGTEDTRGFRPMFFTRETPAQSEAEAQLRLDWEHAMARMVARAYSQIANPERGHLVDLSV